MWFRADLVNLLVSVHLRTSTFCSLAEMSPRNLQLLSHLFSGAIKTVPTSSLRLPKTRKQEEVVALRLELPERVPLKVHLLEFLKVSSTAGFTQRVALKSRWNYDANRRTTQENSICKFFVLKSAQKIA